LKWRRELGEFTLPDVADHTLAMLKNNWMAATVIAQQLEESGEIYGEQVSTIITNQPE
tara:strand:- start:254 stop:427 length:174 start_codon:yes stop_codon:yes gene_type:complete